MGGFGSGNWYRWGRQDYLDDHISLDIRRWKRDGLLLPGRMINWQWSVNDEPTDSIRARVEESCVVLIYRQQAHGGDWQSVEEKVRLIYTPCNFGGRRVWFVCPACERRAAKLYSQIPYFVCRRCCDLPYRSQGETEADRAMEKIRKIKRKLGASNDLMEPIWDKPKGMHWKTFQQLRDEAEKASCEIWEGMARYLENIR